MFTSLFFVFLLHALTCVVSGALPCGGRVFDSLSPKTWLCCAGKPYHISQKPTACCNKVCYNPITQMCCGKKIYSRVSAASDCCNGKFYQRGSHGCCGRHIIDLLSQDCCRTVPYNYDEATCCDGNIIPKDRSNNRSLCCGKRLYNPATEICCAEQVVNKIAGLDTKCCHTTPYDSRTKSCCDRKVLPKQPDKDECCNHIMMDSKTDICCGGHSEPRLFGKHTGCCRVGEPVSPNTWYAEQVAEYWDSVTRAKRSLLGNFVTYDKRKKICCSGKLSDRVAGVATGCCVQTPYDVGKELCCGEKVISKHPGKQERCCGNKPYDRLKNICCHGNIVPVSSNALSHTFCCGGEAYDRRTTACEFPQGKLVSLACDETK